MVSLSRRETLAGTSGKFYFFSLNHGNTKYEYEKNVCMIMMTLMGI